MSTRKKNRFSRVISHEFFKIKLKLKKVFLVLIFTFKYINEIDLNSNNISKGILMKLFFCFCFEN